MQDAAEKFDGDLYAEARKQLGRSADDPEIAEIAARLRAPLHPNCYLSPTQFAEKFGLPLPPRAGAGDLPADAAAADRSDAQLQHIGTDVSDTDTATSPKAAAMLPPGPRHLLGAALIALLLALASWAAALVLPR